MTYSSDIVTKGLYGLVAVGFFAWAGVVWKASDNVALIAHSTQLTNKSLENHKDRRWHEEAGILINRQQQEAFYIKESLDELKGTLEDLTEKVDDLNSKVGILTHPKFDLGANDAPFSDGN